MDLVTVERMLMLLLTASNLTFNLKTCPSIGHGDQSHSLRQLEASVSSSYSLPPLTVREALMRILQMLVGYHALPTCQTLHIVFSPSALIFNIVRSRSRARNPNQRSQETLGLRVRRGRARPDPPPSSSLGKALNGHAWRTPWLNTSLWLTPQSNDFNSIWTNYPSRRLGHCYRLWHFLLRLV